MTTEASNDQGVWVDDYVTSSGTHVAGHWRKRSPGRGGRNLGDVDDVRAAAGGTATRSGPSTGTANPSGAP
ncbi:hypothetical protein, partial [Nocardioides sp.]|uniref:hypothetical protein n=1 Tax=Nocardioides sp. TaxID=35761 RepID=UPI00273285E6